MSETFDPANQARQIAERIGVLANEIVASFQSNDANHRIARMGQIRSEILYGMIPVIGWIERKRPADTADLVNRRLHFVLNEAVQCAGLDIPEYEGGKISRVKGRASAGAERTATLLVSGVVLRQMLHQWADEIESEGGLTRVKQQKNRHTPSSNMPSEEGKQSDQRNAKGDAELKLISGLLEHHRYENGSCGNYEPIGNNALADKLKVGRPTSSDFFKKAFGGHAAYKRACKNGTLLYVKLKIMAQDFAKGPSYGRMAPGEGPNENE